MPRHAKSECEQWSSFALSSLPLVYAGIWFLRKIHANSLINLLLSRHSIHTCMYVKGTKIHCVEFSSPFCVVVAVFFHSFSFFLSSSSFSSPIHCILKWNYRMIQQILQQRNQKTICQSQAGSWQGFTVSTQPHTHIMYVWHTDVDIYLQTPEER